MYYQAIICSHLESGGYHLSELAAAPSRGGSYLLGHGRSTVLSQDVEDLPKIDRGLKIGQCHGGRSAKDPKDLSRQAP